MSNTTFKYWIKLKTSGYTNKDPRDECRCMVKVHNVRATINVLYQGRRHVLDFFFLGGGGGVGGSVG